MIKRRAVLLAGVGVAAGAEFVRIRDATKSWQAPAGEHRRAGALAVRTLGATGPPILLLHGLVASGIFWGAAYDRLADGHRLVVPDLLGFGGSDRPGSGYGPDDHVDALVRCLDVLGIDEPVFIAAHSLGCLLALRLAALHPNRVTGIVGFGPPLYRDRAGARARIGASGPMARLFVLPGPTAERVCGWLCAHHRLATVLAVLTHPRLPRAVAADAVQHNWASYSQTLTRVILDAGASEWLEAVRAPILLVAGDHDPVVDRDFLVEVGARRGVALQVWPGRHHLPLDAAAKCAATIALSLATSTRPAPGA